jgi:hypothetical protein
MARSSAAKHRLAPVIAEFVARQPSLPVTEVWDGVAKDQKSTYGAYWYRAIVCMLLSRRIRPKADGAPNMTDAHRVGKEANFNPYLLDHVARFLIAARILESDPRRCEYAQGPNFAAYWDHDVDRLRAVTGRGVLALVERRTGLQTRRSTSDDDGSGLLEFLKLFFACFRGRALRESSLFGAWRELIKLPSATLSGAAQGLGFALDHRVPDGWKYRIDDEGRQDLLAALYEADWAFLCEHDGDRWFVASPLGLGMLGLEKALEAPELSKLFKVLPNLSVFAGAGLRSELLMPLFRYCVIKRIDQVFEFQLDRRRIAEAPADSNPAEQLRLALRELEPLPSPIVSLLSTKSRAGGVLGVRFCSALVKPENPDVLEAIREHPRLKGYLEPGAPPGYLLIKARSDPANFLHRCRELGFQIKAD